VWVLRDPLAGWEKKTEGTKGLRDWDPIFSSDQKRKKRLTVSFTLNGKRTRVIRGETIAV